ncbi:PEP-CTERM sorting domain-containing protein [Cerasicoccus arenae]|uniref:Ice-binding protein C-terminal domain-containing protein n=1 Tax=Cerasicoccus arenae TaxID=424488 RepID=A0A8J3DJI5_9BACT|nr:PEP-CTERM sorting domain-containing protein [Cerasicoccus arenae]MBK1858470.1 PEP-CTERM sorting domain-containing protein [Cerasicoccus arenae]GHC10457.1 hypothetical protein GCM10007047_29760 [Cerasicoccus arenae]
MKTIALPVAAFSLLAASSAQAIVQAYWDMDSSTVSGKLPPSQGTQAGSISTSFVEFSAGFIGEIQPGIGGTTENILPPPSATNRAVGFFRAGSVYFDGAFEMANFDFTGLTDASLSFAYRSDNVFTWDSNLEIDYRIDDGSWVDFAEGETYNPDWTIATIDFGSILDGQSNVDFRIRTDSWASIAGYLDIDNVQVNAIPEPSTYALLLGISLLGLVAWRRKRS